MQIFTQHRHLTNKLAFGLYACSLVISGSLMLSTNAVAQSAASSYADRNSTPHIQAFYVNEVRRLAAGVDLNFSMYGTPGGQGVVPRYR